MNDIEQKIEELLVDWEAARQAGREISIADLCKDRPELEKTVGERIAVLQRLSWIDSPFDGPDDSQNDLPFGSVDETQLPKSDVTVAEFLEKLTDSGVLTADEIARLRTNTPENKQQRANELASELIRDKLITPYQAKVILERGDSPLLLDRYVILDAIGGGGMGIVFKALQRTLERVVAVKVLPKYAVDSPEKVERFQREMRAVAKLSHPNVVQAYDAHESNGVFFFAMEYVAGSDLADLVTEEDTLPAEQAIDIVRQVAAGLSDAHRNNIIHRDVKPANILLSNDGVAKVLDLGLARVRELAQSTTANQLTRDGLAMGTVTYMSPEQAFNAKQADERSDIYSLGCTLYYLLHGRPMFDHENSVRTIVAHRESPAPLLGEGREDVSAELEQCFQRMVAKDPSDRQASMEEVQRELKHLSLEHEESFRSSAPHGSLPSHTSAINHRRFEWLWPLIGIGVLALLAFGIYSKVRPATTDSRTLATRLISDEVSLIVDAPTGSFEADFVEDLPDEPFEITGATLYATGKVSLEQLASIKQLKSLFVVSQDDDVVALGDLPGRERFLELEDLGLTGFVVSKENSEWIAGQDSLLSLDLTQCQLPADWAKSLGKLQQLQMLTLIETNVTDEDLAALRSLPQLNSLDVSNTRVSGEGLEQLVSLPITELALTGLEFDDGLDLTKFAELRRLYVDGTNFDDEMAKQVAGLPLRLLHVGHTNLGPQGLQALVGNRSLRELGVRGLKVRDVIDDIVALPKLRHLLAENTDLNDDCLEKLSRVEGLKSLLVAGTEVTDSGVERFRLRAPSCAVMQDEMLEVE